MKRAYDGGDRDDLPAKIRRVVHVDRLSRLSDELLIRILSFVPIPSLLTCQKISKKFSRLSLDSELWKAAYYRRFVLPRASRIPGIKDAISGDRLHYSSKLSRWLDDGHLIKEGIRTNWKQQYRLRHNWSQGQCAVSEIVVAQRPPDPPALVMLSKSVVYAADAISGLQAWSLQATKDPLASTAFSDAESGIPRLPTSIAVDASETDYERIAVGFEDGSFSIYSSHKESRKFAHLFTHPPSTNGMLSALALSSPYLLTATEDLLLSLYTFPDSQGNSTTLKSPHLLYSLRSHTAWPPVSLSLRTNPSSMTAAIAYALPTYLTGWTVGVQELRLSHAGKLLDSRLATAADHTSFTLSSTRTTSTPSTRSPSPFTTPSPSTPIAGRANSSKPTSISYTHPYLLVALPDNTLSLYLVKSTSSTLSISTGNRLWGHTSSISGAHVGGRGKAVSVSRRGEELRVWDLEGGMGGSLASTMRRTGGANNARREFSVRVSPAKSKMVRGDEEEERIEASAGLRAALEQAGLGDDGAVSCGWVGFDEQNVLVLREKSGGGQALVVYDFT